MKKPLYGPSIYYATDKNVFDALNQHKVSKPAIQSMFLRRNILVSPETPRVELSAYFSLLNHDYKDHQDIANRLGVVARRERTTSMAIEGVENRHDLVAAIEDIKKELEGTGDVVKITKSDNRIAMVVHYSTIDYRRSEFTQTQQRKGRIEFLGSGPRYVVRSTHSDYVIRVRDEVLERLSKTKNVSFEKFYISLNPFPSPEDRSTFFNDLINQLEGFTLHDVKEAFAYKARPHDLGTDFEDDDQLDPEDEEDEEEGEDDGDLANKGQHGGNGAKLASHVDHVNLKGVGVTRSEFLIDALDDGYYIVRTRWEAKKTLGLGQVYIIEALFTDPANCDEFSFMLKGMFPLEDGRLSKRQVAPHPEEIDDVSHAIETTAQKLLTKLREKYTKGASSNGDSL